MQSYPLTLWGREVVFDWPSKTSFIQAWDRQCEKAHIGGVIDTYMTFKRWCRKMEQSNLGTVYLAICAWKYDSPSFLLWSYWLVKVLVGLWRHWAYLPCKNDNFAFKEKDAILSKGRYQRCLAVLYCTISIFHSITWFSSMSMHCFRNLAVWWNWHWGVA